MLYVNKRGEDDDVDVKRCDVWDLVNLVSNFHEHKVDGKDNAFHRKKTCDFLILFGNWPTLLETKHIPHHLPEETIFPATFEVDMWPLPGGHLSKQWIFIGTLWENSPPPNTSFEQKSWSFVAHLNLLSLGQGIQGATRHKNMLEISGCQRDEDCFKMSLSNPKQTSKKNITPWLEEVQYLTLNLTPKQCTTFNGKNPCTSLLDSQVIPSIYLSI